MQGEHFLQENLFGGKGTVKIWDLLKSKKLVPFTTALACELEPGGVVGGHVQQSDAELIICTSGMGQAFVNDEAQPFSEGALVTLPKGHKLSLKNASEHAPLCYLIIKATP